MTLLERMREAIYQRVASPHQPLSEEEALQIAREEIERHGLAWEERIGVAVRHEGKSRYWDITTRGGCGFYVRIIEKENGHTVVRFAERRP